MSSSWIYGGTQHLFDEELGRFGIDITYVGPEQPRLWRQSVRKRPAPSSSRRPPIRSCGWWTSRPSPTSPRVRPGAAGGCHLRQPDQLPAAGARRRRGHHQRHQVPERPQRRHRGRGGGLRLAVEEVNRLMRRWGQAIDPHAAWLVDRGMRTLALRMERHNANGRPWPSGRSPQAAFSGSTIPACLPPGPRARQGGARRLRRHGGPRAGRRPKAAERHAQAAQAGDPRTEPRGRRDAGLGAAPHLAPGHLRRRAAPRSAFPTGSSGLSCGIEDAEDIIADLEQAVEVGVSGAVSET